MSKSDQEAAKKGLAKASKSSTEPRATSDKTISKQVFEDFASI